MKTQLVVRNHLVRSALTIWMVTVVYLLGLILLSPEAAWAAKDLEVVDLTDGYDSEDNILTGPVFEGVSAPPLVFEGLTSAFNTEEYFIRRIKGGFVRPLRYGISPSLDLAGLLNSALRAESSTMGLRSSPAEDAVKVSGQITEAFMENRGIFGGAILFYGYLVLDLELTFPDGGKRSLQTVSHDMVARVNGGFGARDEAGEAVARFFVQAAQEVVSVIAREHLEAPVHPGVLNLIPTVLRTGADGQYVALRRLGLSGHGEALDPLLTLLNREREEDDRSQVINALANLRRPEGLKALADRYKQDKDEDCRFYSIKAFAYSPGDQTRQWIRDLGTKDKDSATRRLATYWKSR